MDTIKTGAVYRHFKGNYYYVINLATHSETDEQMVIYHPLYGERKLFARPLDMFLEEVPEEKENPTGQKHRFELVNSIGQ